MMPTLPYEKIANLRTHLPHGWNAWSIAIGKAYGHYYPIPEG